MTFPSATCCEHGHQRGKCSECDAAADIADLTAALEVSESEARALRCELTEAEALLDRIGDVLEDVEYKGDYADGVKALLLRFNA